MADAKPPGGTEKAPTALDRLREIEKNLTAKQAELNGADANHYARNNFDLGDAKNRTAIQLAEVKSAIQEATK